MIRENYLEINIPSKCAPYLKRYIKCLLIFERNPSDSFNPFDYITNRLILCDDDEVVCTTITIAIKFKEI